jgi:hypothetical protein
MAAAWKKKILTLPGFDRTTPCVRVQYATTELKRLMTFHYWFTVLNKVNLKARFSYLIMSKAEFRRMTSDFKI